MSTVEGPWSGAGRRSTAPAARRWTVGVDVAAPRSPWGGPAPSRLHAVGNAGLVAGRALCLAPVTLLDPAVWEWPGEGDPDGGFHGDGAGSPVCWVCLALTR